VLHSLNENGFVGHPELHHLYKDYEVALAELQKTGELAA
jgi:hypothetical protein